MTAYGDCHRCGFETGFYDTPNKRWDCGCKDRTEQGIPKKYRKLMNTGRWRWIEKTNGHGAIVKVGIERKSTGEERWF